MDMRFPPAILRKLVLKPVDSIPTLSYELHGHGRMNSRQVQRGTRFGNTTENIRKRNNWQLENDGFLEMKSQ
jgi:hypothetical protein